MVGTIIAVVLAILFYLRLMALQYGKARRARALAARRPTENKKGKKAPPKPAPGAIDLFGFKVTSWQWIVAGITLLVVGAVIAAFPSIGIANHFWWIPVSAGIVIMAYCVK